VGMGGMDWAGLGWAGLGWAGLGWAGLGWAELGWDGVGCNAMQCMGRAAGPGRAGVYSLRARGAPVLAAAMDRAEARLRADVPELGFGRIVRSEIEAPNTLAIPVESG
jgi:hypothetical protein